MDWIKCKYDDLVLDTPVKEYRDFTIALAIPNGGIIAVSIWNWDKSIIETLDTEDFDKYSDEQWHILHAKIRINKILQTKPSKKYSFLEKFQIDKLRFILKEHKIKYENFKSGVKVIKAIEKSELSIKEIWSTLQRYQEPNIDLSDLPLFKD